MKEEQVRQFRLLVLAAVISLIAVAHPALAQKPQPQFGNMQMQLHYAPGTTGVTIGPETVAADINGTPHQLYHVVGQTFMDKWNVKNPHYVYTGYWNVNITFSGAPLGNSGQSAYFATVFVTAIREHAQVHSVGSIQLELGNDLNKFCDDAVSDVFKYIGATPNQHPEPHKVLSKTPIS